MQHTTSLGHPLWHPRVRRSTRRSTHRAHREPEAASEVVVLVVLQPPAALTHPRSRHPSAASGGVKSQYRPRARRSRSLCPRPPLPFCSPLLFPQPAALLRLHLCVDIVQSPLSPTPRSRRGQTLASRSAFVNLDRVNGRLVSSLGMTLY
ncbi:hypothetical protein K474DRAFT_148503 [Panus rudis PR-1116 ss-1]|nr:hypothetical protein K474DRAFT_148503 [Panus rudis PR-1116 ss-1]